jgi:four helix bundle protein
LPFGITFGVDAVNSGCDTRLQTKIDAVPETRLGRHIASQMVRCGTSPAPNYEAACAAESPRDFVHKLAIVLKELRESRVWIRLIVKANLLEAGKMAD